jgi:hypothetical protein
LQTYQQLVVPQVIPAAAGPIAPASPGQAFTHPPPAVPPIPAAAAPAASAPAEAVSKSAATEAEASGIAQAKARKRWIFNDPDSDAEAADIDGTFSIRDSTAGLKLPRSAGSWALPTTAPERSQALFLPEKHNVSSPVIPPLAAPIAPLSTPSPASAVANAGPDGGKPATKEAAKEEFQRSVVNAKNITTTFDKFPYYLRYEMRSLPE